MDTSETTVAVVIGTFGDPMWELEADRAAATAINQTRQPDRVVCCHRDDLMTARNEGAKACVMRGRPVDWLIFLDADDELDEHYIEASLAGEGDIRQPSTLAFYPDGSEDDHPVLARARDLSVANYIVVGAMCRRDLFLQVGGFRDYPVMEDWDLWRRMVRRAGAVIGQVPEAIYRVGINENSRNTMSDLYLSVYQKIRAS